MHTSAYYQHQKVKLPHISAAEHAASVDTSCVTAGAAAKVLLACDTRPSSPALLAAAAAGVRALGGVAVDCGRLTTPQLHWQLRRLNQGLPWALQDYFSTLAGAYEQLVKGTDPLKQVSPLYSVFMIYLHGVRIWHMLICTATICFHDISERC